MFQSLAWTGMQELELGNLRLYFKLLEGGGPGPWWAGPGPNSPPEGHTPSSAVLQREAMA